MSDKDILQTAKEILENEIVLDEAPETSAVAPEVKPKKKGATDVDAEGETPAEAPSVNTDSLSDEGNYSSGPDGGGAEVPEPEASEGDSEENKKSTDMKASSASATAEHMDALFGGEDLSEDFRNKATTIFTVALKEREDVLRTEIQESFNDKLKEEIDTLSSELSEKVDDYLNYVVNEWMEANEIAIEHGLKNEISESFIADLKNLFENHNIEIPEESFDALQEANEKVETLETKLNEQLEKNIELSRGNENLECSKVFNEASKSLTDTDTEKLRSLSEGLEFDSVEQYNEKLNLLKDSYFNDTINEKNDIEENTLTEEPTYTGAVKNYVQNISRLQVPRQS